MNLQKDDCVFDDLRVLAQRLDIRLGVEKRKLILAGNEKLTMSTDSRGWVDWLAGVESRMTDVAGRDVTQNLLAERWSLPGSATDRT